MSSTSCRAPAPERTSVLEANILEHSDVVPHRGHRRRSADYFRRGQNSRCGGAGFSDHDGQRLPPGCAPDREGAAEFPPDPVDLLIIEKVRNLVCPAEFDLCEHLRVMICGVVKGAEKPKKYPLMFHTADVVLLNKRCRDIARSRSLSRLAFTAAGSGFSVCAIGVGPSRQTRDGNAKPIFPQFRGTGSPES
jgi:hypothetical protein